MSAPGVRKLTPEFITARVGDVACRLAVPDILRGIDGYCLGCTCTVRVQ